jgi:hypothetical protein
MTLARANRFARIAQWARARYPADKAQRIARAAYARYMP